MGCTRPKWGALDQLGVHSTNFTLDFTFWIQKSGACAIQSYGASAFALIRMVKMARDWLGSRKQEEEWTLVGGASTSRWCVCVYVWAVHVVDVGLMYAYVWVLVRSASSSRWCVCVYVGSASSWRWTHVCVLFLYAYVWALVCSASTSHLTWHTSSWAPSAFRIPSLSGALVYSSQTMCECGAVKQCANLKVDSRTVAVAFCLAFAFTCAEWSSKSIGICRHSRSLGLWESLYLSESLRLWVSGNQSWPISLGLRVLAYESWTTGIIMPIDFELHWAQVNAYGYQLGASKRMCMRQRIWATEIGERGYTTHRTLVIEATLRVKLV